MTKETICPPIDVTQEALVAFGDRSRALVRFGVKGGGCTGFAYVIDYSLSPPFSTDTTWSIGEITFMVDAKSLKYLSGSRVTYRKSLMYEGFVFENPNEASRCGCGASFSVKSG